MAELAASDAASPDRQLSRLTLAADRLHGQGRLGEAEEMLRLALRIRPRAAAARNALGLVLFDAGRIEDALAEFRAACAIDPGAAGAWGNAGMALKTLDRFDEAMAAYDAALSLDPASPQLRLNRAVALLRAGRMEEAWEDYESRLLVREDTVPWRRMVVDRILPTLREPDDPAGPDLRGRTVIAVHEEGFGDTLMFIRYATLLAERGARVVVRAPRELGRLLQGVRGVAEVVGADAALPPFDYAIPVFSLPARVRHDARDDPRRHSVSERRCRACRAMARARSVARCRRVAGGAGLGRAGAAVAGGFRRSRPAAKCRPSVLRAARGGRRDVRQPAVRRAAGGAGWHGPARRHGWRRRFRGHGGADRDAGCGGERGYVGRASGRRDGQAGAPGGSLRCVLALAERA